MGASATAVRSITRNGKRCSPPWWTLCWLLVAWSRGGVDAHTRAATLQRVVARLRAFRWQPEDEEAAIRAAKGIPRHSNASFTGLTTKGAATFPIGDETTPHWHTWIPPDEFDHSSSSEAAGSTKHRQTTEPSGAGPSPAWVAAERAVLDELERSLEAFPAPRDDADTATLLRHLFHRRTNTKRLLIVNDRLFVHASFLKIDKNVKHAMLHWSVINSRKARLSEAANATTTQQQEPASSSDTDQARRRRRASSSFAAGTTTQAFPNLVALYDQSSQGRDIVRTPSGAPLPTLVISKNKGYAQEGVMVPNPYFITTLAWAAELKRFEESRLKNQPWVGRSNTVFWRGEIEFGDRCTKAFGNFARLAMIALSVLDPEHFDVKCGAVCRMDAENIYRKATAHNKTCPEFELSDAARALVRGWVGGSASASSSSSSGGTPAPSSHNATTPRDAVVGDRHVDPRIDALVRDASGHVDRPDYARFRYVLNLPGRQSGSYSRNLNHLWFLGAVVLLFDAPYVEWYYPALKRGVTHVAVNATTARDAFRLLDGSQKTAQRVLIPSAARVGEQFLCPECLERYLLEVTLAMRRRFRLGAFLDDATAFASLFEAAPPSGAAAETTPGEPRSSPPGGLASNPCRDAEDPLVEVTGINWEESHPRLRWTDVRWCRRPEDLLARDPPPPLPREGSPPPPHRYFLADAGLL